MCIVGDDIVKMNRRDTCNTHANLVIYHNVVLQERVDNRQKYANEDQRKTA